jgi:multiple sugar transport system permease protein
VTRRTSALRRREAFWGILFASPFLVGFVIWTVAPVLASLVLSFCDYTGMDQPAWIGVANYMRAFAQDSKFYPSWQRTIGFALVSLPLSIIAPLSLALLIDQKSWGSNFFRAVYYAPSLTPVVALTTLWGWVLSQKLGLLNTALRLATGIQGPAWLGDPKWVIPAIIMMTLWAGSGGNAMLIFLAALQGVSPELYEAAQIDGAGRWRRFLHVTLPMISPIIFLMLVMNVIGFLKAFDTVFNATAGGPAYATYFIALHIYFTAFRYFEMGYASALAWILFLFTMVLTLIQFRAQKRWVFYTGEGGA